MIYIRIACGTFPFINKDFLYRVADITLSELGNKETDVTISIEKDRRVRELNRQYRGINESTDVLSFYAGVPDPECGHHYLGDVIISLPKVKKQAKSMGIPVKDELALMIIHGILHLHGYDHDRLDKEKEMFALQNAILSKVKKPALLNRPKTVASSFRFAFAGILTALHSERNLRIHFCAAGLVVLAGLFFHITLLEWSLVIFAISIVIITEIVNTALEHSLNVFSMEFNENIRQIKDLSAAAVLIATFASVAVGLIVFLPKLTSALH